MLKLTEYGLVYNGAIVDKTSVFRCLRQNLKLEGKITLKHIAQIMIEYPILATFFRDYSSCEKIHDFINAMLINNSQIKITTQDEMTLLNFLDTIFMTYRSNNEIRVNK